MDDAVRARGLPQCRATVSGLADGPQPGLQPGTSGAQDFLPGRVRRGRQGRVMRVAPERGAATLDLTFEFADAAEELVVELMLLKQLLRPAVECPLGLGEFFRERGDNGLRLADTLRLQLGDAVCETVDEAHD